MHFFYLDETGDTGLDLHNSEQPIFVLGGVSIRDKSWNGTQEKLSNLISEYFEGNIPENFELHSCHLLSPEGEGFFDNHEITRRIELANSILGLLVENSHDIHYFAIDKQKINEVECSYNLPYNYKIPYLSAFDYLITYMNWHVKEKLGSSARGLVIIDEKESYINEIELITKFRRYGTPKNQRIKWIVEFSYPIDSQKNPMVQISDLAILCIRRFLEIENNYRPNWPNHVTSFYANCYDVLCSRLKRKNIVERNGRKLNLLNDFLKSIESKPRRNWKSFYDINSH